MSNSGISQLVSHLGNTAESIAVKNPATGKITYQLPQHTAAQVLEKFQLASHASKDWAATSVADRVEILKRWHKLVLANEDKLLDLLQLETGKSRAHAFEEYLGAVTPVSYYASIAKKTLAPTRTKPGVPLLTKTYVRHEPIGVVGVITPWNYPLALTMLDVVPALVAGNTVLQKADNQTALTALFARSLAIAAGIPENCWQIVTGPAAEVGNAIVDSVDYVAFTGSTATGRIVAQRAAGRLIGVSLELGGKNPMIVLESADVSRAAEIAIAGAVGSAGQLCVSIERVFVANAIKAKFLEAISSKLDQFQIGVSNDFSMDVGSLTGEAQFNRVSGFVADATAKGAKIISGGKALPQLGPHFYAPTVLTDVTEDANLFKAETFGPVISVTGFDRVEDAIAQANDTEYGLNASVVGDEREAVAVAEKLSAGSVNINEGFRASFASMESPMGGVKASGLGRRNGPAGLLKYTEAKTIGISRGPIKLPYRAAQYKTLAPLMRLLLKYWR